VSDSGYSSSPDLSFTPEQVALFQAGLQEVEAKRVEFLYPDPFKLVMAIPEFHTHGYIDLSQWRWPTRPAADTQMYRERPTVPLPRLGAQGTPDPDSPGAPSGEWLVGLASAFRQAVGSLDPEAQNHLLVAIPDLCKDPVTQRGDVVRHLPGELGRFWCYLAGRTRLVYFPDRPYRRVILLILDPGRG